MVLPWVALQASAGGSVAKDKNVVAMGICELDEPQHEQGGRARRAKSEGAKDEDARAKGARRRKSKKGGKRVKRSD